MNNTILDGLKKWLYAKKACGRSSSIVVVDYRPNFDCLSVDAFPRPDLDSHIPGICCRSALGWNFLMQFAGFWSWFLPFGIAKWDFHGVSYTVRSDAAFPGDNHNRLGYPLARQGTAIFSKGVVVLVVAADRLVCHRCGS